VLEILHENNIKTNGFSLGPKRWKFELLFFNFF
jgi:hypothetical protein